VHFTLVFPADVTPNGVVREIAAIAQTTEPIPFTIDRVQVVPDALGQVSHIFLVPNEGSGQIATLHDRLYGGVLQSHLRPDIPFIAHMTVGAAPDPESAAKLAETLDLDGRIVRGTVSDVDLIDVSAELVQSIGTYRFAGRT
jgi:2'-5' RNA ligase